ncbi:MAG: hypothetical protein WBA13_05130 [Microcoleaceae cyanobacterium]
MIWRTIAVTLIINAVFFYSREGKFSSCWKTETKIKNISIVEKTIRDHPGDTLLVLTDPLKSEPIFSADIQVTELKRFEKPTIERF